MADCSGIVKNMLDQICGQDLVNRVSNVLNISSNSLYSTGYQAVETIYNTCVGVALGLVVMYFLFSVTDKVAQGQMTIEIFIPELIKLIAAAYLIDKGFELFKIFIQIGDSIMKVNLSKTPNSSNSELINAVYQDCKGSIVRSIAYMCQFCIPYALSMVATIVILLVSYGRALEIFVRLAVSPLALADCFGQGLNSGGFRYLKKFLAVCLQGIVIVGMIYIWSSISATVINNATQGSDALVGIGKQTKAIFEIVILNFALAGSIIKSQQLVNDVVGA